MEELVLGLAILFFFMIIGTPVAMSFGAMSIYLATAYGLDSSMLVPRAFYNIKSVVLLTIPFFIMIGGLMVGNHDQGGKGLATRLIDFIDIFLGRVKGGLGALTVVVSAMFGSIGGTCSAAVAAIGTVMIPKMEEHGYDRGYSTALVACSSILGQLIPPSVPMILFALVTLQSIPACWLATIGPGLCTIMVYILLNRILVRNMPIQIKKKQPLNEQIHHLNRSFQRAWLALLLPVILLGSIYSGITTPTEAACIAVIYVILVNRFVYRIMNFKDLGRNLVSSCTTTGVLVILLFFTMMVSRILTFEKIPQDIADWLIQVSPNKYIILLMINVFLLLIGMLMDDLSGTVLSAALLYPVMQKIGVHPLHFAAITGVNLGLGNVTPPTAPILFLAGRIGHCRIESYLKPSLILMFAGMLPILLLTTYLPGLSLFLPRLFGFVH